MTTHTVSTIDIELPGGGRVLRLARFGDAEGGRVLALITRPETPPWDLSAPSVLALPLEAVPALRAALEQLEAA